MKERITVQVNKDGQVWLLFDGSHDGNSRKAKKTRQAMLNLNNIVIDMPRTGINRDICLDAITLAGHEEQHR